MRLDRRAQHLVVDDERRPHRLRVGLPPTGRTLDIGEQKRHHPRRSSRRRSGHPRSISQTDTLLARTSREPDPRHPGSYRHGVSTLADPTALDKSKVALARRMHAKGESASTIANVLGVSRATVYRVLAEQIGEGD